MDKTDIAAHFDALAPQREAWRGKNRYYYQCQSTFFRFLVPPGKRVLELGCSTGELLNAVQPSQGVGVDISPGMIAQARRRFPHLRFFRADAEQPASWPQTGTFDFILMADTVGYLENVQDCFSRLHPLCHEDTRLIVSYYNLLWEPALKLAEALGWKMPTRIGNWLSPADLENLLTLAQFETIKQERRMLWPKKIPLIHRGIDVLASFPGINRLCICNYVVARPRPSPLSNRGSRTVSVVIPCKNEKGNIAAAVTRLPQMGAQTEIIFVDGHSQDQTVAEIQRVCRLYPEKAIRCLVQDGTGKGDAVRKGFAHARGEILMILDADLTVAPEELPKFYEAIVSGQGEFINGCRLVYPMQDQAMRLLNLLGNKFFSLTFTWLLNQRIKDTLCGTKALTRSHYEQIVLNRAYFGEFDPFGDFDLLFGASKLNLKILEIPVRYAARTYGQTQIRRFRHGFLLLKMCLFAMGKLKMV